MDEKKSNPAYEIALEFGGIRPAAKAWGLAPSTVASMVKVGRIHAKYHQRILDAGLSIGKTIDPARFSPAAYCDKAAE